MKKISIFAALVLSNSILCFVSSYQQERKPLLDANKHEISDIMPDLYNYALEFIIGSTDLDDELRISQLLEELSQKKYYLTISFDALELGLEVVGMINAMSQARIKGFDEKIMSQYAYNRQLKLTYSDYGRITILFSLLEKYRLTAELSKELLPFENNSSSLKQIINNPDNLKRNKKLNMHLSYAEQYPVFYTLINDFNYILTADAKKIGAITSYLHSNSLSAQKDCPQSSSTALESVFYNKAFALLFSNEEYLDSYQEIYELIQIMCQVNNRISFAHNLLEFEPTLGDKILNFHKPKSYYEADTKNMIALLYILIGQFNSKKDNKKIPIPKQFMAYYEILKLNLPLGDRLMSDALDENGYKLSEALILIDNIKTLGKSSSQEVQNFINNLTYDILERSL